MPTEIVNQPDGLEEDAEIMAQLDAGIAKADETVPTPDTVTPAADEPNADADLVDDTIQPDDPALNTEAKPAEAAKPDGDKPADGKVDQQPEKDQAIEDEIAGYKLSEKASERFRGMAAEIKELAPIKEELTKLGIKSVAELPVLAQRAQVGDDMVSMIRETGANAEQYGMTLDYLGLITAASNGDMTAAEKAFAIATKEIGVLAAMLGKEIPGVHDPLAQHADLKAAVEAGDVTRSYALEVAKSRTQGTIHQDVAKRTREQQAEAQRQTEGQLAQQQGVAFLTRFDQEMTASDPTYAAKRPILNAMVANIRRTMPPSDWEKETRAAYAMIPAPAAPAAAAAPVTPTPGPVRPSGPRAVMVPEFDDPMAALDAGIDVASR